MKKKKWRDIRNAVTMMCVMVAMLSTATYAWFTMTSNPTVTGMEMVASSSSGLSVNTVPTGTFYNAIELLPDTNKTNMNGSTTPLRLVPVTPQYKDNTKGFSLPEYDNSGAVTGLDGSLMNGTLMDGYVARYTYYIKSESGEVNVGIITGNPDQSNEEIKVENYQANLSGTFVRQVPDSDDEAAANATSAIRIGLIVSEAKSDGTGYEDPNWNNLVIYEPNSDGGTDSLVTVTSAPSTTVTYDSDHFPIAVKSSTTGEITGGTIGAYNSSTTTSGALFTVGEAPKMVTMYIWLEGTDLQCVDQIKTDLIEAQIQFTSLGAVSTTDQN